MANKQDVSDAFYEGMTVILNMNICLANLEGVDLEEFREFLLRQDGMQDHLLHYTE